MAIRYRDPNQHKRQVDVTKALAKVHKGVDSGELLTEMIKCWGGVEALARDIRAEFDSAGEGSMTRQRCLEMITRLINYSTDRQLSQRVTPREMSDEQLAQFVDGRLQNMMAKEVGDGPKEVPDAGPDEGAGPPES